MKFEEKLKHKGLKITPARLGILELLDKSRKPLQTEDIWKKTQKKFDQATVYRTVKTLTEEGILKQIDFKQGHAYYEVNDKDKHHHHLVCINCSKVVDIEQCDTIKLEKNALKSLGFKSVVDHSLEFFGVCSACG
jgi:Fur family transcriptional regulator, ferric uptake regulator